MSANGQMPGCLLSDRPLPKRPKGCPGASVSYVHVSLLIDNPRQCCYNKTCKVPKIGSGYCRSVKNNGCPGGKFHAGFCPGNSDIRCCVKTAVKPPPIKPPSPLPNLCTAAATDKLLFQDSISTFIAAKNAKNPACFDWNDDGCSCSPDELGQFDFLPPCKRHDFGYRNTKKQGRFNAAMKERIDSNLKTDLYNVCNKFSGLQSFKGVECRRIADIYIVFVRKFGKKKRDEPSNGLEKRDCDLAGLF